MYRIKNVLFVILIIMVVATCTLVQNINTNAASVTGDVNNDSSIDSIDFALVKSYLLGKSTLTNMEAADTNIDRTVDALDYANIKMFLLGRITSFPTKTYDKVIALTFDDGPDNVLTPLVLDKLEKYNSPATFMMIGEKVNDNTSAVITRIINSGCEIGNHSWNHLYMDSMSEAEIKKQIIDTNTAIQKYSGTTPNFFRAPYIATSTTMFNAIDLTFVGGVAANDWDTSTTAKQRADLVLAGARDGGIIILHDVQPLPHPTPEALDIIIPTLQNQGYEFVTLSELFKIKGVTLSPTDSKTYFQVPQGW